MAIVYPTEAGNWSTRTWYDDATGAPYSNGTPQEDDEVRLNGLTITMDQNITIAAISNRIGTNAAAGGTLDCPNGANGLTLTAQIDGMRSPGIVTVSMSSPNTLTIIGNVFGGTQGGTLGTGSAHGIQFTGTGQLTVNGNVLAGVVSGSFGINVASTGTLIVNGTVRGQSTFMSGVVVREAATVTINGDARGTGNPNASNASGITVTTNGAALITVNGNAIGGAATDSNGVFLQGFDGAYSGSPKAVINGVAIGGTGLNAHGISSRCSVFSETKRSKTSSQTSGHAGNVRFMNSTDPNILTLYDSNGKEFTVNKAGTTAKPSLRGGFKN